MSRPLRIQYPGAIYHVMNRGIDRRAIFGDDHDRAVFLDGVADAVEKHALVLHGYALMGNHHHLLIETPNANLAQGMHAIDGGYAQRHNRRHGRIGPLFAGRYRAILVQADRYFLAVSRYIHRNPAEIAPDVPLAAYRWSSYGAFVGRGLAPAWLTTDAVLAAAGGVGPYREFVERGPAHKNLERFYAQQEMPPVLGDAAFRRWAESIAVVVPETRPSQRRIDTGLSLDVIDRVVGSRFGTGIGELRSPRRGRQTLARAVAIALACAHSELPAEVVAGSYGFTNTSSLRSALARFGRLRGQDDDVEAVYQELEAALRYAA